MLQTNELKNFGHISLNIQDNKAEVILNDSHNRNTFNYEFCENLVKCFEYISTRSDLKVVLVYNAGHFFSAGGTKKELLEFTSGYKNFAVDDFFKVFLNCEIPVLAAMQGHAIGGGLILGLYADLIFLSERSIYTANFMAYGFTPGMGATALLPLKIGYSLGWEMLLTAQQYHGGELKKRGIQLPVLGHNEVIPVAKKYATALTQMPRHSICLLKKNKNKKLIQSIAEAISEEVTMHQTTFLQPEVKLLINELYKT